MVECLQTSLFRTVCTARQWSERIKTRAIIPSVALYPHFVSRVGCDPSPLVPNLSRSFTLLQKGLGNFTSTARRNEYNETAGSHFGGHFVLSLTRVSLPSYKPEHKVCLEEVKSKTWYEKHRNMRQSRCSNSDIHKRFVGRLYCCDVERHSRMPETPRNRPDHATESRDCMPAARWPGVDLFLTHRQECKFGIR